MKIPITPVQLSNFIKAFILVAFTFVLFSCGSRKTETSISDKEKKNDISTQSDVNLNYKFDKLSLEPYNPERPILVNGKEYHNTKIVHHYEEGQKTEKTEIEDKSQESDYNKDRKTERDNSKFFIIIGLGLIFGLFFFFLIVIFGLIWYFNSKISLFIPK